ncbi:hypothetical protein LTR84_009479 [Exophiala bonariae]|uniref:Transcription factor domain-containing protein n=1 Tax=Exophiala bonariae TaxID=1690606 RepID=A0AAV9MU53_9EURO|nr:hypothetical protein LTR84_009479 [Exophiala bonariae]
MVDTLKSIHLYTSSTVDPIWSTGLGEKGQHDLKTLCNALMLEGRILPPKLSDEDYLLILLVLLSTINTLQCSLGPLTSAASSIRLRSTRISGQDQHELHDALGQGMTTQAPNATPPNPHVPFTTDRDYNDLKVRLSNSLTMWQTSFAARATQTLGTAKDAPPQTYSMMALLHLARILLEGGPAMYVVPSLAGYTAEPYETLPASVLRPCSPHKIGIFFSDDAVQSAVKILEAVEDAQNTLSEADSASKPGVTVCPMWYPLALFYGALVLWGRLEEEGLATATTRRSSNRPLFSSRRILQGFHTALKAIEQDWDCARHMAAIVKSLIR